MAQSFFCQLFCSWHIAHLIQRKNVGIFVFEAPLKTFFSLSLTPSQVKTHFLFYKFNNRANVFSNCWNCNSIFLRLFGRDTVFFGIFVFVYRFGIAIWLAEFYVKLKTSYWGQLQSSVCIFAAVLSVAARKPLSHKVSKNYDDGSNQNQRNKD